MAVLGCLGVGTVGSVVACAGGGLVLYFAPEMLVRLFVEPQPLAVATTVRDPVAADATARRVCGDLALGQPTALTGPELSQILVAGADPTVAVLRVDVDAAGRSVLDTSIETSPGSGEWINVHLAGSFTIDHGWFTDMRVDELTLSGWDLGAYVAGQQLAADANRSLADQRAQNPDVAAMLDAFDTVATGPGGFTLVPRAAGVSALFPGCDAYAAPAVP